MCAQHFKLSAAAAPVRLLSDSPCAESDTPFEHFLTVVVTSVLDLILIRCLPVYNNK